MADGKETIKGLLAQVTELTEAFTRELEEKNIPEPTFKADSPTAYEGITLEMFHQRQLILDKLADLSYLIQGPSQSIFNYAHTCMADVAVLNILNHFKFWSAVPLNGSASYADIAEHTKLPEEAVKRILEHAITMRIFDPVNEPDKPVSRVEHSSRSAALAKSPGIQAQVSCLLNDAGPAMLVTHEALQKYSIGQNKLPRTMDKTAFSLLYSGGLLGNYNNSWELLENDGEGKNKGWRQRNFVEFMRFIKEIFHLEAIVSDAIDWAGLGDAKIVDLGGSGGHDSVVLAKKYSNLSIVVEDLPHCESEFHKNLPEELGTRLQFLQHDFFKPQPTQADVYLIKLILHDWPDEEAIKILQNLRPALKPGKRILFIDYVGKSAKPDGVPLPRSIQAMGTATDIRMMSLFSAEERTVESWKKLFQAADERFDIVRVEANPLTFIVVMEIIWMG